MSTKKKKIILLTSLIASIALVIIVCFVSMGGIFHKQELGEDTYSKEIKILNENNVSLVIYGDEVKFRDGVKYENIDEINKSSFKGDEFLVMNDRSSNASLDDNDYIEIKELVSNGVTFIYIGNLKIDTFKEKGFIDDNFSKDCLQFIMSAFSTAATSSGPWDYNSEEAFKINDELLGEVIVSSVVDELKEQR